MWQYLWILVTLASLEAEEVYYHTFSEKVLTKEELIQQVKANTTFWCSIQIEQPCDPKEGRRLDGSCNNLQHPTIGASHTPFVRVLPPEFGNGFVPKPAQSGEPEPPCRQIRTILLANAVRPDLTFTQLATHFFVFAAADTVSIQDTAEDGMNTLLGINLISVWFWRNHNRIASALADLNPCWTEDKTFYTARDINIATFIQILYYEFLPLLLGWSNLRRDSVVSESRGFRDRYNPDVLPQISLEFPYILRWAHLMQEGWLKMYDQDGNYLKQMPIVNLTLRSGYLALDNNIDYMTQGSFRQACGKLDYAIDPDMGERCLGGLQRASDVASSDLEKGRYNGFPPYIDYVKYCYGNKINSFEDLNDFIDSDKVELLRDLYRHVRDIDLLAGTWVEKPVPGGFAPPTFYCIVVDQLIRSMTSDRHWYERPNRPNAFTLAQLLEIRKASISRLLCDVGDKVTHIQRRGFVRVGPKNKIVGCNAIEKIDLTAWKDDTCLC